MYVCSASLGFLIVGNRLYQQHYLMAVSFLILLSNCVLNMKMLLIVPSGIGREIPLYRQEEKIPTASCTLIPCGTGRTT